MAAAITNSIPFSTPTFSSSSCHCYNFRLCASLKPPSSLKLHVSHSRPPSLSLPHNAIVSPLLLHSNHPTPKLSFGMCCALQEVAVEERADETEEINVKKKLCVLNLPWSLLSVEKIKELFGECGTANAVEIIKHKNGTGRGFIFVTMDTAEQAQAVIDKFDSQEIDGRLIKVEFAKRLKPPSNPEEKRHILYVSNLPWKARNAALRDFITETFKRPASTRIVGSPSGRCAGYGFVSFLTEEDAEAAFSALKGKEFMGRPLVVRLRLPSEKQDGQTVESGSENQDRVSDDQSQQS